MLCGSDWAFVRAHRLALKVFREDSFPSLDESHGIRKRTPPSQSSPARETGHMEDDSGSSKRSKITPQQAATLMRFFEMQPLPDNDERMTLAAKLDMTPRSVQVWFHVQLGR